VGEVHSQLLLTRYRTVRYIAAMTMTLHPHTASGRPAAETALDASGEGLSERQRQALAERGLRRYYQTAFDDGYVPRVMPYVWRIIWTVGGLMAVTAVLPTNTGRPAFDALVVFSTWYPIGVMLLVFASRPLGRLIRQRAQERRK